MHPIERLRSVARAQGAGPSILAREAAAALADFGHEPAGLVTACRRLVDRHPAVGPMWSLAARVLNAPDPVDEAWRVADEVDADPTPTLVAAALPEEATVVLLGWPEQATQALYRRGDVEVLLVDSAGESRGLSQRLDRAGVGCIEVPDSGLAAAVGRCNLVVLEALALGPTGFLAAAGSCAAALVARALDVPVWVVAGEGRALPDALWKVFCDRIQHSADEAWYLPHEIVPLPLADEVFGPTGRQGPAEAATRADCAIAPELLKAPA